MYVVSENETGYSDESMRFATKEEALDYMEANSGVQFNMRYED